MYSLRFYGRLEDLKVERRDKAILVDSQGNLITLTEALDFGAARISKGGDVPFLPFIANDYQGSIYLGPNDQLEFSPNLSMLERSRELATSNQLDELNALQIYYGAKGGSSQIQDLVSKLVKKIRSIKDSESVAYQLLLTKLIEIIYMNLEIKDSGLFENQFLKSLTKAMSEFHGTGVLELDGYRVDVKEAVTVIAKILLIKSQNEWEELFDIQLNQGSQSQYGNIILIKAIMKRFSHCLTLDSKNGEKETKLLDKFLQLFNVLELSTISGFQTYFDMTIFASINLNCLGYTKSAKSLLDKALDEWEQKDFAEEEMEILQNRITTSINEAILRGKPLVTFSYKLAVLIWKRIALNLDIFSGSKKHENSSFSDFLATSSRRMALKTNETILFEEQWSPILGTFFAYKLEIIFPKILKYTVDTEKKYASQEVFSYSIHEYYDKNYQKSIDMLSRNLEKTKKEPIFDVLRQLFITYNYQRWFRENEKRGIEYTAPKENFYRNLSALVNSLNSLDMSNEWLVLEFLPIDLQFPFKIGGMVGTISIIDRMITGLDTESEILDSKGKLQLKRFLSKYQTSPVYMQYINHLENLEQVIEFQENVSTLSEAYWSRNYNLAERLYNKMPKPSDLINWRGLSRARSNYIDDMYPSDLRQRGMVVDLSQYYVELAMYNWGKTMDYGAAISLFDYAVKEAQHPLDKSRATMNIGTLYLDLSDFDNCQLYYDRSFVYIEDYQYIGDKAIITFNLAYLEYCQGKYELAISTLKNAISFSESYMDQLDPNTRDLTESHFHPYWFRRLEYWILIAQGRINDAIFSLEEQLRFAKKIGKNAAINSRFNYMRILAYSLAIIKSGKLLVEGSIDNKNLVNDLEDYLEVLHVNPSGDIEVGLMVVDKSTRLLVAYCRNTKLKNQDIHLLREYLQNYEIESTFFIPSMYILSLLTNVYDKQNISKTIEIVNNTPQERSSYSQKIYFLLLQAINSDSLDDVNQNISKAKSMALMYNDGMRQSKISEFENLVKENIKLPGWIKNQSTFIEWWQDLIIRELIGMHHLVDVLPRQ